MISDLTKMYNIFPKEYIDDEIIWEVVYPFALHKNRVVDGMRVCWRYKYSKKQLEDIYFNKNYKLFNDVCDFFMIKHHNDYVKNLKNTKQRLCKYTELLAMYEKNVNYNKAQILNNLQFLFKAEIEEHQIEEALSYIEELKPMWYKKVERDIERGRIPNYQSLTFEQASKFAEDTFEFDVKICFTTLENEFNDGSYKNYFK